MANRSKNRIIKWGVIADSERDQTVNLQYLIDHYGVEILSSLHPGVYKIDRPLVVKGK